MGSDDPRMRVGGAGTGALGAGGCDSEAPGVGMRTGGGWGS